MDLPDCIHSSKLHIRGQLQRFVMAKPSIPNYICGTFSKASVFSMLLSQIMLFPGPYQYSTVGLSIGLRGRAGLEVFDF
jgi:hypothetical protein